MKNILSNFLIVGAQKAATTSLYEYLIQHPKIFMSRVKEPAFFSSGKKYALGTNYYANYFTGYKGEPLVGEASTSYSQHLNIELIIDRIYKFNSDMKFIYILRDPIDRAYSAYWYNVRDQIENLSFKEAITIENERINRSFISDPYSYLRRGLYINIIKKYLDIFPKENFYITFFDDFKNDYQKVCNDIFTFLGIEHYHLKKLQAKNIATLPKNKLFYKLIHHPNFLRDAATKILSKTLKENTKIKIRNIIDRIDQKNKRIHYYTPMKLETRQLLINYYKDSVRELETFTNRDLKNWLKI